MTAWYQYDFIKQAILASAMSTDADLTFTVRTGEGAAFITAPCVAVLSASRKLSDLENAEHVIVSSIASDVFTVTRDALGDGNNIAWPIGTLVLGFWSPLHLKQVTDELDKMQSFLANSIGRTIDGVIRDSTNSGLKVIQNGTPDLYVKVNAGYAYINDQMFRLAAQATLGPVTPPVSGTRTDCIQADPADDTVEYVTNQSSADAGKLLLATVEIDSGATTIVTADITDARVFI